VTFDKISSDSPHVHATRFTKRLVVPGVPTKKQLHVKPSPCRIRLHVYHYHSYGDERWTLEAQIAHLVGLNGEMLATIRPAFHGDHLTTRARACVCVCESPRSPTPPSCGARLFFRLRLFPDTHIEHGGEVIRIVQVHATYLASEGLPPSILSSRHEQSRRPRRLEMDDPTARPNSTKFFVNRPHHARGQRS
jgi:hypothetical protein